MHIPKSCSLASSTSERIRPGNVDVQLLRLTMYGLYQSAEESVTAGVADEAGRRGVAGMLG